MNKKEAEQNKKQELEQLKKAQTMIQENPNLKILMYGVIGFMVVFILYNFTQSFFAVNSLEKKQNNAVIIQELDSLNNIKDEISPEVRERFERNKFIIDSTQKKDPLAN